MCNATTSWREEKPPGKIAVRFVTRFIYRSGKNRLWPKQLGIKEFPRPALLWKREKVPTLSQLQRRRGRADLAPGGANIQRKIVATKTLGLLLGLAGVGLLKWPFRLCSN